MPKFGENIRRLRKAAKYTQKSLADSLNVKQSTVSRWENGIDHPNMENLPALAALLHCTTDDLFGYNAAKDPHEVQLVSNYRTLSEHDQLKLIEISQVMVGSKSV